MPHAVGPSNEDLLQGFLDEEDLKGDLGGFTLDDLNNRELDLGEKDNDARDFGDISDDDLADDDTDFKPLAQPTAVATANDDDDGNEPDPYDDLFGEELESPLPQIKAEESFDDGPAMEESIESPIFQESEEEDADTREQRLLFEQAQREREERLRRAENAGDIPPPPPTNDELFSAIWPQFEADRPPRFGQLLPGKKAYYLGKAPLKPPRQIQPSKVHLELQTDQEKTFRLPAPPIRPVEVQRVEAEAKGLVLITQDDRSSQNSEDEEDLNLYEELETVGGLSWQDLVVLCEDWDIPSHAGDTQDSGMVIDRDPRTDDLFLEDDFDTLEDRPAKRKKLEKSVYQPLRSLHNLNASFESPEKATAKLAKKVHLDLNDPHLLVDVRERTKPVPQRRHLSAAFKRDAIGGLTKDLTRRYNISNDDAYDLLKQNHQNKVRGQIGNTPVEHAGPALRLQYPFYKQMLDKKEARSWHRPALGVIPGDVTFKKPISHKRKHMRGKEPREIFIKSSDLSIGDNSSLMLLEYSEEHPPVLASFGMGSRLINYYRRKDNEDTSRPKLDIGETSVLLPQDKSPFDRFGDVDGGQTVPTLSNAMFRAPVFKHEAKPQDFLVSRSSTGLDGPVYHLRNIENLHVVGQEFPFVAVPGPKARQATNVQKYRLQMVSYRLYNKYHGRLTMDMLRKHNPYVDLPTIRTKMKDFMAFDKSAGQGKGVWRPKSKSEVPDEAGIRALVKPDDVVMVYSMQVGEQHLADAGYHQSENRKGNEGEDENEEGEDADGPVGNLDGQLAPWETTKNFLQAAKGGAMIEVHGEGDPTGRGEALSMIKTSMKGGFKAIGQSIEDRLDAQKQKELGGHKYNVARQNQEYAEAIARVWKAQARSLASTERHDDVDMEEPEEDTVMSRARTPNSLIPNDTASVYSRDSQGEQSGKILKIVRRYTDKWGNEEYESEIVRDPKIIREYQRRRRVIELENMSLAEIKPTGDKEADAARKQKLQQELDRLQRNQGRALDREKAKIANAAASIDGVSPDGDDDGTSARPAGPKRAKYTTGATQRKCANCGQIGHIKTNKKYLCTSCSVDEYMSQPIRERRTQPITTGPLCPMLNGTIQQGDTDAGSAFGIIGGGLTSASPQLESGTTPTNQNGDASSPQPNGASSFE